MHALVDDQATARARLQHLQDLGARTQRRGPAAELGRTLIDTFKQALLSMERSRRVVALCARRSATAPPPPPPAERSRPAGLPDSPKRRLEQQMLEAVVDLRGYACSVTILCTLPETAPPQYLMAGDRDGVRRVWNALATKQARESEAQP
jgi:hypothetical protein